MLECNLQPEDRWGLQGAKRVGKSAADSPVSPFAVTGGEECKATTNLQQARDREAQVQHGSEGRWSRQDDQMRVFGLATAPVEQEERMTSG